MNEKTLYSITLGVLVLLAAALFFSLGERQIVVSGDGSMNQVRVSGSAQKDVAPDKALVALGVSTEGKDAKQVQERSRAQMNQVMRALKDTGVRDDEIETTTYALYPFQEWDPLLGKSVDKGFRLDHTIMVTTTKLDGVGALVDAAVENGANTVQSIAFTLSDGKQRAVHAELLAKAAGDARERAAVIAESLGVALGKAVSVSELGFVPPIFYARSELAAEQTAISPRDVTVSVQVDVGFEIE